jgi:Tol biopolymer transport system component
MVEGLAEYLSLGSRDPHTAMWMRDAVMNGDIPTLKDLTRGYKYFPYRYGHAFWSFVTGVYGDSIIYPLFKETARSGLDHAIKKITGLDEEAFSKAWKARLTEHYNQFRENPATADSLIGEVLIGKENSGDINIAPVVSPNGRYVAFLSEKNFFSIDLFLADAHTGEVIKTLSSTARESHIDEFSFIESAGSWSPHSDRFAFSVVSKGRHMLIIADIGNNRKVETIEIPGVPSFSNPSWSPSGEEIIVAGLVDGQSDLYLFNLKTQKVTQMTDDRFSDYQPRWSPDGNYVLFVSDRSAPGRHYQMGALQLCVMSLPDQEIQVLDLFHGAENLNPAFSPNREMIYFLSNRDGFRNIYKYDLIDGNTFQLTKYFTGVSGITPYAPAMSISPESGDIVYTYYSKGDYSIYKSPPEAFLNQPVGSQEVNQAAGVLSPPVRLGDIGNHDPLAFQTPSSVEIKEVPYKSKFGLEYIGNEVGIGIANGALGTVTGMQGGVNALFGDMLGRQKLYASLMLNGEIYDMAGQFAYLNQKHRVNFGVSLSHIPYRASSLSYALDSLTVGDGEVIQVENYTLDVLRIFEDNATVFMFLPFSQTRRVEFGTGYSFYSTRYDRYHNYYYLGAKVGEEREKLDAPEGYRLGNVYSAYVFDNSYFGLASPARGKRYRFEISTVYDELNYQSYNLDYRKYFFINPMTLAFRAIHIGRFGPDAESDRIYPLSFAYPTLTRGNNLSSIEGYGLQTGESYSIDQIFGSRMFVGNVEWRLPFTGPERLALLKSHTFLTEFTLFTDVGLAWDSDSRPVLSTNPDSPNERIPFITAGASLRVNLFGQVVLEPYYAFPWRGQGFGKGTFGLNLSPGW